MKSVTAQVLLALFILQIANGTIIKQSRTSYRHTVRTAIHEHLLKSHRTTRNSAHDVSSNLPRSIARLAASRVKKTTTGADGESVKAIGRAILNVQSFMHVEPDLRSAASVRHTKNVERSAEHPRLADIDFGHIIKKIQSIKDAQSISAPVWEVQSVDVAPVGFTKQLSGTKMQTAVARVWHANRSLKSSSFSGLPTFEKSTAVSPKEVAKTNALPAARHNAVHKSRKQAIAAALLHSSLGAVSWKAHLAKSISEGASLDTRSRSSVSEMSVGFTGEICTASTDCAPGRTCINTDGEECPILSDCICFPSDPIDIQCDCFEDICVNGEVCTILDNGIPPVCVSEAIDIGTRACPNNMAIFTPEPIFPQPQPETGLTGELCTSDSDCAGTRTCLNEVSDSCTTSDLSCICFTLDLDELLCDCSDPSCTPGESCLSASADGSDGVCFSNTFGLEPLDCEPQPTNGGVLLGLNGDFCNSDFDCSGNRVCINGSGSACSGSFCFCFTVSVEELLCNCNDLSCPFGEVCTDIGSGTICLPPSLGAPGPECDLEPSPSPEFINSGGLDVELCLSNDDCTNAGTCVDEFSGLCRDDSSRCFCIVPDTGEEFCDCDNLNCPRGSFCANGDTNTFCASKSLRGTLSDINCDSMSNGIAVGLNGSPCSTEFDCAGSRNCTGIQGTPCAPFEENCVCISSISNELTCDCSDPTCPVGESCKAFYGLSACLGPDLLLPELNCSAQIPDRTPVPTPTNTAIPGTGLSGDECTSDIDCAGSRACEDLDADLCTPSSVSCVCLPVDLEDAFCGCVNATCQAGEFCTAGGVCISDRRDLDEIVCP